MFKAFRGSSLAFVANISSFFLSFKKKKKETNYALKRKVNAIPNSWAIVRLLQL